MPRRNNGFTLLELLLVVFLLGVMAMTTFAVVQEGDDQQRFEATQTYYQLIKKAVIGDAALTLNGESDLSGFVADMGRLPNCLRELIEITGCDAAYVTDNLPTWTQDPESLVWSGWRGPYMQGIPESGGLTFRDGWKNKGAETGNGSNNPDASNYGWLFGSGSVDGVACSAANAVQLVPNALVVQSCGSNGKVDAVPSGNYADDYPVFSAASFLPLVAESDHQVVLGKEWETLMVEIVNDAGPINFTANSLRLSVNYPINGAMPVCAATGANACDPAFAPQLSAPFPAFGWNATTKVATFAENDEITFPAGTTPLGVSSSSFSVVQDSLLTIDDGSELRVTGCSSASPCTVTTSVAVTVNPSTYQFIAPSGGVTLTFQMEKGVNVQFAVNGLTKPYVDVPANSEKTDDQEVTLPDETTLTFNNNVVLIPFGKNRARVMVDSAASPAVVTVSTIVTAVGNRVSVDDSSDQFMVPPGSIIDSATQITLAAGLGIPAGQRSITVVCNSTNNVSGKYRELFDGVCDGEDDDGTPIPVLFKFKPRTTSVPPSPLRWQIR